ncbi:glycosyltransferase family protein [Celeribacter sp. ULVN23_4]
MTPPTPPSFAIIFVLYHAYDAMKAFLATQSAEGPEGLRFIIVDNTPHAQTDHAALAAFETHPNVTTLIAEPENLGYAGAAHFAMRSLLGLKDCDYIAISNTDLHYDAAELLAVLSALRTEHDGVGAIAPRLTHPDGAMKAQLHYVKAPSRAKYSRLVTIFSSYPLALTHRLGADLKRMLGFSRGVTEVPHAIFAPHGALMILTRAYFEKTTGFEHPAFLFCEEITVGANCRDAGLKVIYEPRLSYAHDNHGAMGAIPSRRIVRYLHEAHKAVLPRLR